MSFVTTNEFLVWVTKKNHIKDWCLTNPQPTFVFFTIFGNELWQYYQKGCKPDNLESHNSLKFSFTNIRDLHSDFSECKFFLELNSPGILSLCETNLNDSVDSGNFSVSDGYLLLIQEDSVTHMHVLAVYVKEGLPFLLHGVYI